MEKKYILNESIMIQELKNEKYLLDLDNEKTYSLNQEGFDILSCIEKSPKSPEEIYSELSGGSTDINPEDLKCINEFINELNENRVLKIS